MPAAFKIYRIICTITDKALVYGSDYPNSRAAYSYGRGDPVWFERGSWSDKGGTFWKTDGAVKKHLQNLCHDWVSKHAPVQYPRYVGELNFWREMIPGTLDWSRLEHLTVEELLVTNYSMTRLNASNFMGIPMGIAA